MTDVKRKKLTINRLFFVMLIALFFIVFVPLFITHNENFDVLYTATLEDALRIDAPWLDIAFLHVFVAFLTIWLLLTSLVYDKHQKNDQSLGLLFKLNFSTLGFFIFIGVFYVILGIFSIMIVQVDGTSMEPNLSDKQLIVIREDPQNLNRTDIVLVENVDEDGGFYIKRIIGLPNEWVIVSDKEVLIDDKPLDESNYLSSDAYTFCINSEEYCYFGLSNNDYMVLGDNRQTSTDSRDFGRVYSQRIRGKLVMKLWPFW